MFLISGHEAELPVPPAEVVLGRGYRCVIECFHVVNREVLWEGDMPMVPRIGDFVAFEGDDDMRSFRAVELAHVIDRESGTVFYEVTVEEV